MSGALYVAVYFYAAWIYDGFSMPVAIIVFVMVTGFCYWQYRRYLEQEAKHHSQPQTTSPQQVSRPTLSFWRSPLPYIAVAAVVVIVIGMRL